MPRANKDSAAEELLQLSALTASANATGGAANAELQAALTEAITEILTAKRERIANDERIRKEQIESTRLAMASQKAAQDNCRHRKEKGESALAGQRIGGFDTGHPVQLTLVCTHCQKNFHSPPLEGQTDIPRELLPGPEAIGGQLS